MSEQTRRYGESPPAPPISQRPQMPKPLGSKEGAEHFRPGVIYRAEQSVSTDMMALINALAEQAAAINRLAQSNESLVQAMAQDGEMGDDLPPTVGLNGKPL